MNWFFVMNLCGLCLAIDKLNEFLIPEGSFHEKRTF